MRLPSRLPRPGFSLIELLVVIAIVALLLTLALPLTSSLREQSREASCLSRLRQTGILARTFANEHNGRWILFRDGSSPQHPIWFIQLRDYAGLSQRAARETFGCPSFPVNETDAWFSYGVRLQGAPGETFRDEGAGLYRLPIMAVEEPSRYLLFADSISPDGRQTFRLTPPRLYAGSGIHLRHRKKANVLFLDGHAQSCGPELLRQAGIETVLDAGKNALQL